MKSKAPLVMMEQMVMILVFALAAALCLQAFVLSDSLSQEGERRDKAVLLCQNLAEECKAGVYYPQDGDSSPVSDWEVSEPLVFYYDENGQQTDSPSAYRVEAEPCVSEFAGLARAQITAYDQESGKNLYSLYIAWQDWGWSNG